MLGCRFNIVTQEYRLMKALLSLTDNSQSFFVSKCGHYPVHSLLELTSAVHFSLSSNPQHLDHLHEAFLWKYGSTLPANISGCQCCPVLHVLCNSTQPMPDRTWWISIQFLLSLFFWGGIIWDAWATMTPQVLQQPLKL